MDSIVFTVIKKKKQQISKQTKQNPNKQKTMFENVASYPHTSHGI
jgi:hypothetical protein